MPVQAERATSAALTAARDVLRATRRQNLMIACSEAGSQVALAAKLAAVTGSTSESKQVEISRILSGGRSMSEAFSILLEVVMQWPAYSSSTLWRARRQAPRAVPKTWHGLDVLYRPAIGASAPLSARQGR